MYAIAVLEKIKELSLLESNSLIRRQVKTSEEMGELSEAVLCVDDPNGTSYKNLTVQDVKEECVDVILCVLSTFYHESINGTTEELLELCVKKCMKWEETSINKTRE